MLVHRFVDRLKGVAIVCLAARLASAGELPVVKPEAVGLSAAKLARVDEKMDELIKDKKLAGGIVAIARHGKVAHFKSYGLMDIDANKPMRDDAVLRIYSMTKAITTAAALILYDEQKLKLDDPVSKYLPEFKSLTV